MDTRTYALARIEAFLVKTGMSAGTFGMEAVGDHKLVKRLRSGAGVTLTSIEKAEAFMESRGADLGIDWSAHNAPSGDPDRPDRHPPDSPAQVAAE
jgi:hypothetical protein